VIVDWSVPVLKQLLRENLIKPSKTIKWDRVEISGCASIQASIIPCVTDIETGKTSTKGYFIIQLMGRALQEFSQNHKIMKFQLGIWVTEENAGSEVASGATPENSARYEKKFSFTIRNKKGQLKCLVDLISHEDLLQIRSSEINVVMAHSISCHGS